MTGPTVLELPVPLTPPELLELGRQAAQLFARAEALDENRLEANKVQRQEVQALRNEARALLMDIRRGAIERAVRVSYEADATHLRCFRTDTGELVSERPLTEEERQGRLFALAGEVQP